MSNWAIDIPVPEDDISDWLYMQNGKMVGNYTLRVLFKQMSASEVEKYKAMLADRIDYHYLFVPRLEISSASVILSMVLEGRRIASGASRGRKVRTPQGVMPRNSSLFD